MLSEKQHPDARMWSDLYRRNFFILQTALLAYLVNGKP